ncbi:hypothetical protein [Hydrocarboniphaga sp.]|uniref:hypothetical protein n=1 Tax=Hydrocarboniphaga sp. TaxID=2033016 RepID=UPI002AB8A7B4|nr:hypothetical protein [Hydrocarboniphaga sp.]MDZ4077554.1 hypothetical protein [Hydrocarboniphaga sp.]
MKSRSFVISALVTAALVVGTANAQSDSSSPYNDSLDNSPSAGAMAFDLIVVRPISLVATVLGSGLFILSLPLALVQRDAPIAAANKLVVEPARYTFDRPLGVMEQ